MAQIITFQLVRNRERARELLGLVPQDQVPLIEEVLNMEVEEIPSRFRFRVHTADIEQTEEAKKQAKLTLTQLYTMYGREVFQILPMVFNPQVPPPIKEVATKFFIGATNLMEDVFEGFGEEDTDRFLPYIRDIEMMVEQIEAMKDQRLQGGGARGRQAGAANVREVGAGAPPLAGATGPYGGASTAGPGEVSEAAPPE
jgi:hypothetical protein